MVKKPKTKQPRKPSLIASDPPIDRISCEVEPIENGFIATHTMTGKKAKNGYETRKVYHKDDPREKARPNPIFKAMKEGPETFTQDTSKKKSEPYTQDRKGKKKAETFTQRKKK